MGHVQTNISMLRLLVLVALVGLSSAGGMDGKKGEFMKKYAHHKIMESCFGRDLIKKYYVSMMEASKKCGIMDPNEVSSDLDFKEIINEIRAAALQMGSNSPNNQYYKLVPVLQGGRYRREVHDTTELLNHVKEKITHKIANVTCMLRELDWIKEDKTPNYPLYEIHINGISDAYLKDQLLYGLDMCKDYANCMPVKKAKSPFKKELGTYIAFQQCMEMQKLQACFKKDFRYMMADFGFDAVEQKINMGLELLGDKQPQEGYEAYETLENALMGEY